MSSDFILIKKDMIKKLIPHRPPFLWIDEVQIQKMGLKARGYKFTDPNEKVFKGHFPIEPIFPGVLIVEALAQTAAVLLNHQVYMNNCDAEAGEFSNKCGYLGQVNVKFLEIVPPGRKLELDVEKVGQVGELFLIRCLAHVNGRKVAEGKISVSHPSGGTY